MTDISREAVEARLERNKKWLAKFGPESPIVLNEIQPLDALLRALLDRAEKAEARVVLFERMQMPGTIARTVGKASSLTSVAIPITGNNAVTGSAEEKGK